MKTQASSLLILITFLFLAFACQAPGPDYRDSEQAFVYTAEYVENFVEHANLFLEDSISYKKWFSAKPQLHSYYMLLNHEWPYRVYENRIVIEHDRVLAELTAADIQQKIEKVKSGNPDHGHYHTHLDTFDTQRILINAKVKEWKDGKSKDVVVATERIEFQKRKIGNTYAWFPIEIYQKPFKRTDYSWVSSYPNKISLNPNTNLPEGEINIYLAVAHCQEQNYCDISSRLNVYPNGIQYYSGAKIGGRLTVGDIRMKNGEIEFGLMGSRVATRENELIQGTSWNGKLYSSNSGKGMDSLTYSWKMRLDTSSLPFTSAPIAPLLTDEED